MPERVGADAPGRVNLLGEHTDYNGGFVLPAAIPQRTRIALALRRDDQVEVQTATLADRAGYRLGEEQRTGTWLDYIQGVTGSLRQHGLPIEGFNALVE